LVKQSITLFTYIIFL